MHAFSSISQLDTATLTPIVRRILKSPTAVPLDWTYEDAGYRLINEVTRGLYHVAGHADDRGRRVSWTAFVKVLSASGAADADSGSMGWNFRPSDEPTHWNYWKREALVYTSGLLDDLPPGLRAPRCFGMLEHSPAEVSLWLEEVRGVPAARWSVERFGLAARHMGQFQGAYLAGRPLPTAPWLSRRWLRQWTLAEPGRIHDSASWQHPLIRPHVPAGAQQQAVRLWVARDVLFDALEQAPQTLCHFDFWPPNLFAGLDLDDEQRTVLIDWAYTGHGALAEDTANLVMDCVWMFKVDAIHLPRLEQLIVEGYAAGLHEAGWRGDERVLRFAHAAVTGLRYGLLAAPLLELAHDGARQEQMKQWHGLPIDDIIARRAAVVTRSLELAEEAIGMLPEHTSVGRTAKSRTTG